MGDCIQREFGCSCAPGECRSVAVDLGRFEKPRSAPHDTTALQYGMIGLVAFIAILAAAPQAFERVAAAYQEDVRWQK